MTAENDPFDCKEKLVVVEDPDGTCVDGKIAAHVRKTKPRRLLAVGCDPASARYMAKVFSTPREGESADSEYTVLSYLDKDAFSWERYHELAAAGKTDDFKLAVCFDVIRKIPHSEMEHGFDLVVTDNITSALL